MAINRVVWVRNLNGALGPLRMPGLFAAGATKAIKRGEILEQTAGSSDTWVPLDSDFGMNSNVAVADEEVVSGDRAGYYGILVPRPGDVFRFLLAAANDVDIGTPLYFSDSETVTISAGSNIIGNSVGFGHYPFPQGHLSVDGGGDLGVTIPTQLQVEMVFTEVASYWSIFQTG